MGHPAESLIRVLHCHQHSIPAYRTDEGRVKTIDDFSCLQVTSIIISAVYACVFLGRIKQIKLLHKCPKQMYDIVFNDGFVLKDIGQSL